MNNQRTIVDAHMRNLVGCFRCHEEIVEYLKKALGQRYLKGTLSQKLSGYWNWNIAEIIALENAANRYPVSEYLAQRLPASTDKSEIAECLIDQSGTISVEVGEAVQAILKAQKSESSDDGAKAIAEIQEAIEALEKAQNRLMVTKKK